MYKMHLAYLKDENGLMYHVQYTFKFHKQA
jgi:hypothetical protein